MEATSPTTHHVAASQADANSLAIDEAFAQLPDNRRRVDRPQSPTPRQDYALQCQQLIATIGEQLRAIDAQRSRLDQLLRDLHVPLEE